MHPSERSGDSVAGDLLPEISHRLGGPRLVGRTREIEQLEAEIDRVRAGELRTMLVTGGAGIGKTRLATEVLGRHARDAVCLSARSYRLGATTSLGPWIEALDRHLRGRPPDDVRRICGPAAGGLAPLMTTVAAALPPNREDLERDQLLDGLIELFGRLSAERPVLLVLDDAHLADSSSWEALRYLARRLSRAPIGILVTARPTALARRAIATEVLVGLDDDGLLHRLELAPLSRADLAELAAAILEPEGVSGAAPVPEALLAWLQARSLGHPLFVVSLLQALVEEGGDVMAPRLDQVPQTLRARIELDLQGLDDRENDLLELLSVVDRRIELDDLQRLTGWPPGALAARLEHLCRARLLDEETTDSGVGYEVAHPIIQETVYEGIGAATRRMLHGTIARTLLDSGQLAGAVPHIARSAGRRDAEAVDALCEAMQQAEHRGLYQEALTVLATLLEVLPAGDQRWTRVLDSMTWQSEWVLSHLAEGDAATAVTAMERIREVVERSGDTTAVATVRFHLAAFQSFGLGEHHQAELNCRAAISLFEDGGESERALLARNELAWIRGCAGDLTEHARLAAEVHVEALSSGSAGGAVQAAGTAGYALGMVGRFEDSRAHFQWAVEHASRHANTYRMAWDDAQLGLVLGLMGRVREGISTVEQALALDPSAADALAHEDLAHCRWLAGDLAGAVAEVERSAVRRPIQGSWRRAWGMALAARLHAEMGSIERARRSLEQAEAVYDGGHIMAWSSWCGWSRALLLMVEGDAKSALRLLGSEAARLADIGGRAYEGLVLTDLAEAAARDGDVDACGRAARRLVTLADELGGGLHPHLAELAAGWFCLASGDRDEAVQRARAASEALQAHGFELLGASARQLQGRALERSEPARAVTALEQAARTFERCGAAWRRDQTLQAMRRLGNRGRRAVASVEGPSSMTAREREVAQLAACGYTAREIAGRLYIGRRTVESHLANVYAKLRIRSKRDLVRQAHQLGLADP